jgi:predicted O-methyltransferase YrrM
MTAPTLDPTPIFELVRGSYATELLTAAVAELDLFTKLSTSPMTFDDLRTAIGLADRPARVLVTAMRAMGLLTATPVGLLTLSPLARDHLVRGASLDITGYVGLAAGSPGVKAMIERLRTNRPAGAEPDGAGAAFIFREGLDSAMEREASARELTLALAGRAKCVAPILAQVVPLSEARTLLDIGGGTGVYAFACLRRNPELRAIIWDRPEVLKVAAEFAQEYGVADRVELQAGDMFADPVPPADVMLLSNVLHDWDVPQCEALVARCATALPRAGRLLIHDVFLNDALDGPLPIALYSAALFTLTEGRAYCGAEYHQWLRSAGLVPGAITPTLIHCGVLEGRKAR